MNHDRIARRLITLRMYAGTIESPRSHAYLKAWAAYTEACQMASLCGLGPTRTAVEMDVDASIEFAGPAWENHFGAFTDHVWMDAASAHLVNLWN